MIPDIVSLETLAKLADLVCFLECRDVLGNVPSKWIRKIWQPIIKMELKAYREVMLWLHVTATFRDYPKFSLASRRAITLSRGPIRSLGLQIDEKILGTLIGRISLFPRLPFLPLRHVNRSPAAMNTRRNEWLIEMVTPVREFALSLHYGQTTFSDMCDCLLLGALHIHLPLPALMPPEMAAMASIAVIEITDAINQLEVLPWGLLTPDGRGVVKEPGDFRVLHQALEIAARYSKGLDLHEFVNEPPTFTSIVPKEPQEPQEPQETAVDPIFKPGPDDEPMEDGLV